MKNNGFTLLEIILVLSLMTLILSLSAVFFAGFLPSVRADATGREITALIRYARSLAQMKLESQTVVLDLDNRTYGIEGREIKSLPPDLLVSITDPLAGEIARGKYPIVFRPTGGTGGGTINLFRGKRTIRIELDPITGAVMIRNAP